MPILTIDGNANPSFNNGVFDTRVFQVDTDVVLQFFRHYSVRQPALAEDTLGLYSYLNVGRNGKARFGHLGRMAHLLSKRKRGCVWNPKGRIEAEIQEFDLCAYEYNGEQCPDVFYDNLMEKVLGVGNQVRDIFATEEGRAIMNEVMREIMLALGDSVNNIAYWMNHPVITQANTNSWYEGLEPSDKWKDFVDQQINTEATGGWMTLVDALKTSGEPNFNVDIGAANVDGANFTGDPSALFQTLKDNAKSDFKVMLTQLSIADRPAFIVTEGIFNAYRNQLTSTYGQITEAYRLYVEGFDGIAARQAMPNVLMWNGHPVILNTQIGVLDALTGVNQHRAILTAPGNMGLAIDSDTVRNSQYDGIGLRVTQRTLPPYQGKVYMDTTFRMGQAIVDSDFMVSAALVLDPDGNQII